MRHRTAKDNLNRFSAWRKATLLSMVKNLLRYQRIRTTLVKARLTAQLAERLISLAKKNTLAAKRRAFQILGDHKLVSFLFTDIGPRFEKRASGFTRILKLGSRRGDNAEMVTFELVEIKEVKKKVKAEKAGKEVPASQPQPQEEPEKEKAPSKPQPQAEEKKRPQAPKKPAKGFLGGIRKIFKKERDSL